MRLGQRSADVQPQGRTILDRSFNPVGLLTVKDDLAVWGKQACGFGDQGARLGLGAGHADNDQREWPLLRLAAIGAVTLTGKVIIIGAKPGADGHMVTAEC